MIQAGNTIFYITFIFIIIFDTACNGEISFIGSSPSEEVVAVGNDDAGIEEDDIKDFRIEPKKLSLLNCQSKEFKAIAILNNDEEKDVTKSSTWGFTDKEVGEFSDKEKSIGLFRAKNSGKGFVVAKFQKYKATAEIKATNPKQIQYEFKQVFGVERRLPQVGIPGEANIRYAVTNLNASDEIKQCDWDVRSVDFSNPEIKIMSKKEQDESTCLYTQEIDFQFNYRYIPESSAYKDQHYDITVGTENGDAKLTVLRTINIVVDNIKAVKSTFYGEGGSPDAQ